MRQLRSVSELRAPRPRLQRSGASLGAASGKYNFCEKVSERAETIGKRPLALRSDAGIVLAWRRNDFQRLRSHGGTAVRPLLYISRPPGCLTLHRPFGNVCPDEDRLSAIARTRGHLSRSFCRLTSARQYVFPRRYPRHASLDQVRPCGRTAFGTGETRHDFLSGMVSGPEAPQQGQHGILQGRFLEDRFSGSWSNSCLRGVDPPAT